MNCSVNVSAFTTLSQIYLPRAFTNLQGVALRFYCTSGVGLQNDICKSRKSLIK